MDASGEETETGAEGGWLQLRERLRRVVRWLRDLHRGYAYTGHLPRRRN